MPIQIIGSTSKVAKGIKKPTRVKPPKEGGKTVKGQPVSTSSNAAKQTARSKAAYAKAMAGARGETKKALTSAEKKAQKKRNTAARAGRARRAKK